MQTTIMTKTIARTRSEIIIRPVGSSLYKRQDFTSPSSSSSSRGRIGEVAGGTAAECAAVLCCCPFTVVNLGALVVYKLPAGIYRKVLRKHKRRQMIKQGLVPLTSSAASSQYGRRYHSWEQDEFDFELGPVPEFDEVAYVVVGANEVDSDFMELEKEMWNKFHSTGFWRSPSQREQ